MSSPEALPCPCCGYATLGERGGFEICPVCYWEDDGQDDADAELRRGGPNRVSLSEARRSYLEHGCAEAKDRTSVRPPLPTEPQLRRFALEGEALVERAPLSREAVWNMLHDGTVHEIEPGPSALRLHISALYLRERFQPPGAGFVVQLKDCSLCDYEPYDERVLRDARAIAAAEPDLTSARTEGDTVVIWGSGGKLRLRYDQLSVFLDTGEPISVDQLFVQVRAYWAEFARRGAH